MLKKEKVVWKYILPKVVQLYVISCIMTKLLGSVHCGRDDIMTSAVEHGRVPPHQSNRDSTEKLARWFSLVTALLSGQGLPQSPHHIRCHTMESPKSFYCQRREFKPLGSTSFCSISHFPIIGFGESLACFRCCACYIGWGERAGNCDIYSNILAIVPSSDEVWRRSREEGGAPPWQVQDQQLQPLHR